MSKRKSKIQKLQGINLNQLSEMAKVNPRYTQIFAGLAQIDNIIKKHVEEIVAASEDTTKYYVKTEIMSQCYTLYLFNAEKQATVGTSWPLADFLEKCEKKKIGDDVRFKVEKMIQRFDVKGLSTGEKINWVY